MTPNTESVHERTDDIEEFDDESGVSGDQPRGGAAGASTDPEDEQAILERLERMGLTIERAVTTFRKEHHTDHRLLLSILTDQNARIRAVERALRSSRSTGYS